MAYTTALILQILGVLAQVKTDKDLVDTVIKPVEKADQLFQDIQDLQKKIEELECSLDFRGPGVRSLEETQSELTALQGTK